MTLLMPCGAYAAGLGRLTVLSTLGQPLNAEVEVLSAQKNESITGRLATPEVYQQANAQYNNALVGTRVSVEKRPNGQIYLRVTTPRPINEPFVELLVEINSENGRVLRQYTALLDPPGYGRAAGEIPPPAVASAPVTSAPAATPAPSVTPLSPDAPAASASPPVPKPVPGGAAGATQYGPIKRGETLGRIARSIRPEGVTLEQTLVGLYRQNPDAFIKKNMNLVKSGKILRVPEANEMASLPQRQAVQEVRLQVADFNSYRQRAADRVANAPEGGSVTSGRIGTRLAEGPGEGPRDTVRLSRGESTGKGKGAGKAKEENRVRALEEEAIAREKALAEANARIAQLEQIIKDSQRAAELKTPGAPVAKGPEKGAPGAVAVAPPAVPAPKAAEVPPPAVVEAPKPPEAAPPPKPAPPPPAVAKAKPAPPPPPVAEESFVDTLLNEPLYLAAAGGAVLLGGLGFMMARRRRGPKSGAGDDAVKIAPSLAGSSPPAQGRTEPARTATLAAPPVAEGIATPSPAPVTPITPVPPVAPIAPVATPVAPAAPASAPKGRGAPATADDNDLDFGLATGRAAAPAQPPLRSSSPAAEAKPEAPPRVAAATPRAPEPPARAPEPPPAPRMTEPAASPRAAQPPRAPEPLMPDFALDQAGLMPAGSKTERTPPVDDPHVVDFNLDPLPPIGAPMNIDKVSSEPPASVDFKLDLADLDLNAPPRAAGAGKDDHWYDVQQKFDLAKAYEEMGDKDGARDILQEVLREGDGEQQAQAKKLLSSLS